MEKETGECNIKRIGTREEVFRGHAIRTAGGLKRDDIISKQLGTKIIYISKKLSAKMKENFNIIRASNPNYFKKQIKKIEPDFNKTYMTSKDLEDYLDELENKK